MARGRFLSTSVAEDDRLSKLSMVSELLYLKTIPHLDRDGMISGKPGALWGKVCPLREELMPEMQKAIDEWIAVGLVIRMATDTGPVLFFPGFLKNNNLLHYDRETPSKFPVPPGYERTDMGLIPEGAEQKKKPTRKPKEAQVPPSSNGNGAHVNDLVNDKVMDLSPKGEEQVEVKVEVKVEVQGEGEDTAPAQSQPTPPAVPTVELRARNGATSKLRFHSPHIDKTHFDPDTGYIAPGKGTTAVEVYYERFDICHNEERLTVPMEDDLMRHCPDLERLRAAVTAYSRAGFKTLRNIKLILDWYREPERYQRELVPAIPASNGRLTPQDRTQAAGDQLRAMLIAQGKEQFLHG